MRTRAYDGEARSRFQHWHERLQDRQRTGQFEALRGGIRGVSHVLRADDVPQRPNPPAGADPLGSVEDTFLEIPRRFVGVTTQDVCGFRSRAVRAERLSRHSRSIDDKDFDRTLRYRELGHAARSAGCVPKH